MANWLQSQIRAAEGLLEAVDRTAKHVSKKEQLDEENRNARVQGPESQRNKKGRRSPEPSQASLIPSRASSPSLKSAETSGEPLPDTSREDTSTVRQLYVEGTDSKTPQRSANEDIAVPPLASLFGAQARPSSQPSSKKNFTPIEPHIQPIQELPVASDSNQGAAELRETHSREAGSQAKEPPKEGPDLMETGTEDSSGASPQTRTADSGEKPPGERETQPDIEGIGRGIDAVARFEGSSSTASILPEASSSVQQDKNGGQYHPGAENGRNGKKEQNPTVDAVAEAIKAATAVTGNAEAIEDVDSAVDSRIREARLVKMVESLKRRVEQLKGENTQLEELLRQADVRVSGKGGDVDRLETLLAKALSAETKARAELIEEKNARVSDTAHLNAALDMARQRGSELQTRLAAVEQENVKLLQEREASEARTITMLRDELAAAERRLEDEKFSAASAHQSSAMREQELEAALTESGAALATQQRMAEERGRKLGQVENRAALLEAEVAQLRNELEEHFSARPSPEASGMPSAEEPQIQTLKEKAASLQAALSNSESKKHSLESEIADLRADMETLRMQTAGNANLSHMERQIQEMSDLLYQKQSQLEKMAAERSAQHMAYEQQLALARDETDSRRRSRADKSNSLADGDLVVPMEDIGETYHRLANNKRVGKAVKAGAKMLDATTMTVVRFLRQYPLGRLVVLAYAIFIHLFVYTLIHHLQQQALHTEHNGLRLDQNR